MRSTVGLLALVFAAAALSPSLALAQGDQSALAETLFREGKRLMDQKRYEEGCPKLAESFKVEAATGTLLALALCHEGQGKTASAWAEYNDVASRARNEGNKDREQAARDRVAALEPNLSRLTLRVNSETASLPGLSVKRDGLVQPAAAWGVPVPVDPGDHAIDVAATGRKALHLVVKIGAGGDKKEVAIPLLEAESAAPLPSAAPALQPTGSTPTPLRPEPTAAPQEGSSSTPLRTAGWVVGGLGVVGLGLGTLFAVQAMGKNSDSKSDCTGDFCGDQGFTDRTDARSAGNRATVGFVLGGVLVAGGVTMILLGGNSGSPKSVSLQAAPAFGAGNVGLVLKGRL